MESAEKPVVYILGAGGDDNQCSAGGAECRLSMENDGGSACATPKASSRPTSPRTVIQIASELAALPGSASLRRRLPCVLLCVAALALLVLFKECPASGHGSAEGHHHVPPRIAPASNWLRGVRVIAHAASANHFDETRWFMSTLRAHHGHAPRVLLYDLGLTEDQLEEVRGWCNWEIRRFDFSKYPAHVSNLLTYAWKPILLWELVAETGGNVPIFYSDSSTRVRQPFHQLVEGWSDIPDFVIFQTDGPVTAYTNNGTFEKMGLDAASFNDVPMVHASLMFIRPTPTARVNVLNKWLACALDKNCIAPPDSDRGMAWCPHWPLPNSRRPVDGPQRICHRFDQSVLSILLHQWMPNHQYLLPESARAVVAISRSASNVFDFFKFVDVRGWLFGHGGCPVAGHTA
eukprot:Opistho-1_new@100247